MLDCPARMKILTGLLPACWAGTPVRVQRRARIVARKETTGWVECVEVDLMSVWCLLVEFGWLNVRAVAGSGGSGGL
jgi:hypothetical protein